MNNGRNNWRIWVLKQVRWLVSRARAISMLARNYKTLRFHLNPNIRETSHAARGDGLSRKIHTQKFISYLHFFLDCFQLFFVNFQTDNFFVCSIPRVLEKSLSKIECSILWKLLETSYSSYTWKQQSFKKSRWIFLLEHETKH